MFAVLLLTMPQGAQWHSLSHFGEAQRHSPDPGLKPSPDDAVCPICALFAGGASAAPNDASPPPLAVVGASAIVRQDRSCEARAPSFYLSRAPPVLA